MMYGHGWGDMGSWGWFGMAMMLLFWFGLVALIIWAIAGGRSGHTHVSAGGPSGDEALTILRNRYARGEITADEFEQARRTLEDSRR